MTLCTASTGPAGAEGRSRHTRPAGRVLPRSRNAATSGSLGRLSVRRIPGLHVQHMHNPPAV